LWGQVFVEYLLLPQVRSSGTTPSDLASGGVREAGYVLTVNNKFKVRKSTMCTDVEITSDHPVGFGVCFSSLLYRKYVLALLKDEFAWNNVKDKLASLDLHHSGGVTGVLVVWWE
jgi:hypothetical protein